jgi:hypothetical protein
MAGVEYNSGIVPDRFARELDRGVPGGRLAAPGVRVTTSIVNGIRA